MADVARAVAEAHARHRPSRRQAGQHPAAGRALRLGHAPDARCTATPVRPPRQAVRLRPGPAVVEPASLAMTDRGPGRDAALHGARAAHRRAGRHADGRVCAGGDPVSPAGRPAAVRWRNGGGPLRHALSRAGAAAAVVQPGGQLGRLPGRGQGDGQGARGPLRRRGGTAPRPGALLRGEPTGIAVHPTARVRPREAAPVRVPWDSGPAAAALAVVSNTDRLDRAVGFARSASTVPETGRGVRTFAAGARPG